MIGLIKDNDDTIYQQQLAMFVNHCDANFLELNVSKTKEMIIDFRISCSPPSSIVLKGSKVDRVSSYKYLGIMIDDKLAWHDHIDYLIKRLNVQNVLFQEAELFSCWQKNSCFVTLPSPWTRRWRFGEWMMTQVGSHNVTLISFLLHRQSEFTMLTFRGAQFPLICNLTVQPILEWKKPKSFVYAVPSEGAFVSFSKVSFSKVMRVVTNVYSLAERKTLQFNFLAHLDKGVSQEIFGRRIERLSCVICYHVNSLV